MSESEPKKKRRPWRLQLVLPRSGRLTRGFWILKEGMTQPVRRTFDPGSKCFAWQETGWITQLRAAGYLEARPNRRGRYEHFHTTPDGAFAVLIAQGIHDAKKAEKMARRGDHHPDAPATCSHP